MLSEPATEGKPLGITGSAMLYCADTKEEVLEQVKKDVYYEGNVWDKEKVGRSAHIRRANASQIQVIPFKSAFRKAL